MANQNTDFLRFSAYSIKDLIVRKLSEDTAFSDQNFPASNLNILIDLVSYMYQVLLYNLNNAAAESMFSDTQLYENMNRLCKFIGYNPMGAIPGHCLFSFPLNEINENSYIPKYSALPTSLIGSDGKQVFFSTGSTPIRVKEPLEKTQTVTLYNGIWKLSPRTFVFQGNDWEEITLDGIVSDASQGRFTGHQMVDIYAVEFEDDNETIKNCQLFKPAPMGLFRSPTTGNFLGAPESQNEPVELRNRIFANTVENQDPTGNTLKSLTTSNRVDDRVFDLRLNENKTYTVRFGDGVTGIKPPKNSVLYVMYFEAGADIQDDVAIGTITNARFTNTPGFFGMSNTLYTWIIGNDPEYRLKNEGDDLYELQNVTTPTNRKTEESVDEIRENAPNWFKLAGRLVTQADYEYYISTSPDFGISNCKCQNNWEYVSTFYKWLYEVGIKKHRDGSYYLNQNNMSKMGWKVADAADGNNVYIWYKDNTGNVGGNTWKSTEVRQKIKPLKDMTHEIVIQPAIQVDFAIAAFQPNEILSELQADINQARENGETVVGGTDDNAAEGGWFKDKDAYIEVTVDTSNLYTSPVITREIAKTIFNYFQASTVGQFINYNDILNQIFKIPGVRNVRTVRYKTNSDELTTLNVYNGLSFMTCVHNMSVMDVEDNLEIGNSGFQLQPFQSANLLVEGYEQIQKKIKLISKSGTMLNPAQY